MRQLLFGAVIAALAPLGVYAQSAADLAKGQNDTQNILNYGMGYDLQRYSPLSRSTRTMSRSSCRSGTTASTQPGPGVAAARLQRGDVRHHAHRHGGASMR